MSKIESYIIGLGLGALIPIFGFVFFWWLSAALNNFKILSVPESSIKIFALTGFAIGIVIDILFLKRLVPEFYKLNIAWLIFIYLFCSAMAVAFFMGFPIGNLLLGMVAGGYMGRKYYHIKQSIENFSSASKSVSLFTAFITAFEALPIGLLTLREEYLMAAINQILGIQIFSVIKFIDILLIVLLCIFLFIAQYFCTRLASKIAFNI